MTKKTSLTENGLIWFGASVSIAEIITGTYFAPLGFQKGLIAIITGHIIGAVLLILAGVISGLTCKSSMETAKISFGQKGGFIFAFLNIVQLIGWTGIMIQDGANAANSIFGTSTKLWALIIGFLIALWIIIGIKNLKKLNFFVITILFFLTLALSFPVFKGNPFASGDDSFSFGAAVELSVAMPLSWVVLIGDYTREARRPVAASVTSAIVYSLGSLWMYLIGMSAAIFTSESEVAGIILKAGLGVTGLLIVVLSTVTTTFLDAYSAGVSGESLSPKAKGKFIALFTVFVGTMGAIFFPLENITDFLYLIGSVFAPMTAILIADFFILKKDFSPCQFNLRNIIIWIIGFAVYRILMRFDIPTGSTLPDMIIILLICIISETIAKKTYKKGL